MKILIARRTSPYTNHKGRTMSYQLDSTSNKRLGAMILAFAGAVIMPGAAPVLGQTPPSNGVATNVVVSGIGIVSTLGNMAFIEIAGSKTGNPACSSNGQGQWSFVLPLTNTIQQQMLTALMQVHGSNSPVTLVGNGLCDTYSSVETLTNIIF